MSLHHLDLEYIGNISLYWLMLLITLPGFFLVGYPIIRAAFISLKNFTLNMDVMYSMGISVALISSILATIGVLPAQDFIFYDTVVMLAAFLSLGRYLEERARGKTSQVLKKLVGLVPKNALVEKDGNSEPVYVPIEMLKMGDLIVVKPGERIPVDGTIIGGATFIDESMITGEPVPVRKTKGDAAVSGTVNTGNTIRFKANKVGKDTLLSQIIRLVEEAQGSKPRIQKAADLVVSYFIPIILAVAISSFLMWFFLIPERITGGNNLILAVNALIAILVVACPCALGLATPTAVTVGIGKGAELGILIKNGNALEIAGKIDTLVFDKTGTLTVGKPEVAHIISYDHDADKLLFYLASIEKESQHPLANAIAEKGKEAGVKTVIPQKFINYDGKGVYGKIDDSDIYIGKKSFIEEILGKLPDNVVLDIARYEREAFTVVLISIDSRMAGLVLIADKIQKTARGTVEILKNLGISVIMLTGDNETVAESICRQVGIDEFKANVLPADKASFISSLQQQGQKVAFVGDGINDAPALALSDLGIAVGKGTDIAIESGDIVLVSNNLYNVPVAIDLSKKVMKRIKQNIFWAFAYNMLLVPLAFGLLYPFANTIFKPEFAGLAMSMSSFTVVSLSLLLKRYKPPFKVEAE